VVKTKKEKKREERLEKIVQGEKPEPGRIAWPEEREKVDKQWRIHAPKVDIARVPEEIAKVWLNKKPNIPGMSAENAPKSKITKKDVVQLMESEIVEKMSERDVKGFSIVYKTPEVEKKRFRLICDCIVCNVQEKEIEKVKFGNIGEVKKKFVGMLWAACFDFRAWYYQLAYAGGEYCAFKVGKQFYKFLRAPMGHKNAVAAAHNMSLFLSEGSKNKDVIIDNVCIMSREKNMVVEETATFLKKCEEHNVTLSEGRPASQMVTHRGMVFDLVGQCVKLKEKFVEKFSRRADFLLADLYVSERKLESLLSMFAYCRAVGTADDTLLFSLCKQLARQKANEQSKQKWWTDSRRELEELKKVVLTNKAVPLEEQVPPTQVVLFVDASPKGWGAVMVKNQRIFTDKGKFAKEENIAVLEMKAVKEALRSDEFKLYYQKVVLYTDNEVVRYALKAKRSRCLPIHKEIKTIMAHNRAHCLHVVVERVDTKSNPADPLSRGKPLLVSKYNTTLQCAEHIGLDG
jgi:hypothetical protein